eukprot:Platyproteum_vivax@DN1695_c0_g1_i2.p1
MVARPSVLSDTVFFPAPHSRERVEPVGGRGGGSAVSFLAIVVSKLNPCLLPCREPRPATPTKPTLTPGLVDRLRDVGATLHQTKAHVTSSLITAYHQVPNVSSSIQSVVEETVRGDGLHALAVSAGTAVQIAGAAANLVSQGAKVAGSAAFKAAHSLNLSYDVFNQANQPTFSDLDAWGLDEAEEVGNISLNSECEGKSAEEKKDSAVVASPWIYHPATKTVQPFRLSLGPAMSSAAVQLKWEGALQLLNANLIFLCYRQGRPIPACYFGAAKQEEEKRSPVMRVFSQTIAKPFASFRQTDASPAGYRKSAKQTRTKQWNDVNTLALLAHLVSAPHFGSELAAEGVSLASILQWAKTETEAFVDDSPARVGVGLEDEGDWQLVDLDDPPRLDKQASDEDVQFPTEGFDVSMGPRLLQPTYMNFSAVLRRHDANRRLSSPRGPQCTHPFMYIHTHTHPHPCT